MKPECEDCEVVEQLKRSIFDYKFAYTVGAGFLTAIIWLTANAKDLENEVKRNAEKLVEYSQEQKELKNTIEKELKNTIEQLKLNTQANTLETQGLKQAINRALDRFDKIVAENNHSPK